MPIKMLILNSGRCIHDDIVLTDPAEFVIGCSWIDRDAPRRQHERQETAEVAQAGDGSGQAAETGSDVGNDPLADADVEHGVDDGRHPAVGDGEEGGASAKLIDRTIEGRIVDVDQVVDDPDDVPWTSADDGHAKDNDEHLHDLTMAARRRGTPVDGNLSIITETQN